MLLTSGTSINYLVAGLPSLGSD